jgi:hypothetical protein
LVLFFLGALELDLVLDLLVVPVDCAKAMLAAPRTSDMPTIRLMIFFI